MNNTTGELADSVRKDLDAVRKHVPEESLKQLHELFGNMLVLFEKQREQVLAEFKSLSAKRFPGASEDQMEKYFQVADEMSLTFFGAGVSAGLDLNNPELRRAVMLAKEIVKTAQGKAE